MALLTCASGEEHALERDGLWPGKAAWTDVLESGLSVCLANVADLSSEFSYLMSHDCLAILFLEVW